MLFKLGLREFMAFTVELLVRFYWLGTLEVLEPGLVNGCSLLMNAIVPDESCLLSEITCLLGL